MSLAPLPAPFLPRNQSRSPTDIAGSRECGEDRRWRNSRRGYMRVVRGSVGRSIIRFRRRWGCCSCFRIAFAVAPCPCGGWWSAWPPYYRWGIGPESRRQLGLCDRTDNPWVARPDTCDPADRSSSRRPCIDPVIRAAPPVRVTAER